MKQPTLAVPGFRRALIASATIALALTLASPLFAQAGQAEREGRALRIGIIGSGTMGGAIGLLWAEAGHQILFSSRNPHELMDLVQSAAPRASAGYADAAALFGDVILLAVPPAPVFTQFPNVSEHVMEAEVIGLLLANRVCATTGVLPIPAHFVEIPRSEGEARPTRIFPFGFCR